MEHDVDLMAQWLSRETGMGDVGKSDKTFQPLKAQAKTRADMGKFFDHIDAQTALNDHRKKMLNRAVNGMEGMQDAPTA